MKLLFCFWRTCIRQNFVFVFSFLPFDFFMFLFRCVALRWVFVFSFPFLFLYLVAFVANFIVLSHGNVAVTGKFYLDLS